MQSCRAESSVRFVKNRHSPQDNDGDLGSRKRNIVNVAKGLRIFNPHSVSLSTARPAALCHRCVPLKQSLQATHLTLIVSAVMCAAMRGK